MRNFLYSRWFFLFLAIFCVIDLIADVSEGLFWDWITLNRLSIVMDVVILVMAVWMFIDLERRRPKDGGDSGRR
jgi:hypothetical protein